MPGIHFVRLVCLASTQPGAQLGEGRRGMHTLPFCPFFPKLMPFALISKEPIPFSALFLPFYTIYPAPEKS